MHFSYTDDGKQDMENHTREDKKGMDHFIESQFVVFYQLISSKSPMNLERRPRLFLKKRRHARKENISDEQYHHQ